MKYFTFYFLHDFWLFEGIFYTLTNHNWPWLILYYLSCLLSTIPIPFCSDYSNETLVQRFDFTYPLYDPGNSGSMFSLPTRFLQLGHIFSIPGIIVWQIGHSRSAYWPFINNTFSFSSISSKHPSHLILLSIWISWWLKLSVLFSYITYSGQHTGTTTPWTCTDLWDCSMPIISLNGSYIKCLVLCMFM